MTKSCAAVATKIHANMCNDNGYGYSWEERWGYAGDKVKYTINNETFTVNRGDYDCSSSTITAWKTAISKTKYAGKLDGATYTGNMRSVFVGSGLFEWKPISFIASPGDLYLNEANHVAMCQTQVPDILSEFSWGDNGAYGNKRGDQSGGEAHLGNYYDYPWDGILHYNGKADNSNSSAPSTPSIPSTPTAKPKIDKTQPRYAVRVNGSWYDDMYGLVDSGGSNDDYAGDLKNAIQYLAVSGVGKYRVKTKNSDWLPYVSKYNLKDEENGMAGDGSTIVALEIPSSKFKYQVCCNGSWYDWMLGKKDLGGSKDTYAGDGKNAITGIRIKKA